MAFNTRQVNFIARVKELAKDMQDIYGRAFNLKESFTEEFASAQDNDLDLIESESVVDADSASGQVIINIASVTGFKAGDSIIIDKGGVREEVSIIETVGSGALTLTANLLYTHTSGDGDAVETMGPLYDLGLDYAAIATVCNQPMTQFVNFWAGDAVNTREYGNDVRRVVNNEN